MFNKIPAGPLEAPCLTGCSLQCSMNLFASVITIDVIITLDNTLVFVFRICKLGQYLYFGGCGRQILCTSLSSSRFNLRKSTACRYLEC